MKKIAVYFIAILLFVALAFIPLMVFAKDFTWNRSADLGPDGKEDVKEYHLYICKVPPGQTCVATDAGALWVATIPQVPVGQIPTYPVPENVNGSAVVTAADFAGNISDPSNMVSFNTVLNVKPLPPGNLQVK